MTFISVLASATAVLFLWPWGLWVLIAVIPYALAYISYRGSVIAGRHYGSALNTLINLDRFVFYEQVHMPLPPDIVRERSMNKKIVALFDYAALSDFDDAEVIAYDHSLQDNQTKATSQ